MGDCLYVLGTVLQLFAFWAGMSVRTLGAALAAYGLGLVAGHYFGAVK